MLKLLAVLAPVLILSGCCQVFGICTSLMSTLLLTALKMSLSSSHIPELSPIRLSARIWQCRVLPPAQSHQDEFKRATSDSAQPDIGRS